MKTIYLLLALLLSGSASFSQAYVKDYLRNKMDSENMEHYPILIKFKKQADIAPYKEELLKRGLNRADRQKLIIKKLYEENTTPAEFSSLIRLYANDIKDLKTYWLVNAAACKASKTAIEAIAELESVESIQYDLPTYGHKVEKIESDNTNKAPGQAEAGLVAINARGMWNLGYTGQNTVLMSFDTGVNLEHSAVGERYLGHYLPQSETWFGMEYPYPFDTDRAHYHGTHTTGTVLGLDKANNDTIGVAFNAFWKACDLIVSNIEDVRPMSDYYTAFEWAANPDGDLNTSHDIPDVINNSWGVNYGMWPDCNPVEYEFIANLEAADCTVLFSAGNEGPGESTIGMPAGILKDSLNVFSVGALNANSGSFPIANFSSRGPSFCTDNDPIAIKPEVSAPGVNVRSAASTGNYIELSGTSMACPHTSGAALLLREAFPNITSQELKNALYQTATDLGEVGEDNDYGRGLINVLAAYEFLSETHTPTPPVSNDYDLNIELSNNNLLFACSENHTYTVKITNKGTQDISNFTLRAFINGNMVSENALNLSLSSGETTTENLTLNFTEPENEVVFEVYKEGIQERNIYNNKRSLNVHKLMPHSLPYTENFEQMDKFLQNSTFVVKNPDHQKTWLIDTTAGLQNNTRSLKMPFSYYTPREAQKDYVIVGMFDIPQTNNTFMYFKHAYTQLFNSRKDSLYVLVSNSCDADNNDTLWVKGGADLKTRPNNSISSFMPTDSTEWASNAINLTQYAGQSIIIKFMSVNDAGNNLYIDELEVKNGASVGINELDNQNLTFYPNPAKDKIFFGDEFLNQHIDIVSAEGKVMLSTTIGSKGVDISKLPLGNYIVKSDKGFTGKLLIQK